jgi:hypothetical protein
MNLVTQVEYTKGKSDYYNTWEATLRALDRTRIWIEGQLSQIKASHFRNTHETGHNITLFEKRGEKFATNALSKDRTLGLIRRVGIDKAMRATLSNNAGAPKLLDKRQTELWAMSYNNAQNSSNTSLNHYMRIMVNNDPDLESHTRTIKRAIKSKCISLPRVVVPSINMETTKVCFV